MITEITAIYAINDDLLKAIAHKEDCRIQMSDAEVLTTALVEDTTPTILSIFVNP